MPEPADLAPPGAAARRGRIRRHLLCGLLCVAGHGAGAAAEPGEAPGNEPLHEIVVTATRIPEPVPTARAWDSPTRARASPTGACSIALPWTWGAASCAWMRTSTSFATSRPVP